MILDGKLSKIKKDENNWNQRLIDLAMIDGNYKIEPI
jgi:hypothetical protein